MADIAFDPTLYTRGLVISLSNGIVLSRTLAEACPKTATPLAKKAAKKLQAVADTAQEAQKKRQRELELTAEEIDKLIDQEADGSWSALRTRLQGLADLPGRLSKRPAEAQKLLGTLFGKDGLAFLRSEYPSQLAVMDSLLQRIDEDKLAAQVDALAGPEFLAQIRDVHVRYHKMVTGRLKQDDKAADDLRQHVAALRAAIVDYANKITAMVDEDAPETFTVVRQALQAIVNHREQAARKNAGATPPAAPDATVAAAGGEPEK